MEALWPTMLAWHLISVPSLRWPLHTCSVVTTQSRHQQRHKSGFIRPRNHFCDYLAIPDFHVPRTSRSGPLQNPLVPADHISRDKPSFFFPTMSTTTPQPTPYRFSLDLESTSRHHEICPSQPPIPLPKNRKAVVSSVSACRLTWQLT